MAVAEADHQPRHEPLLLMSTNLAAGDPSRHMDTEVDQRIKDAIDTAAGAARLQRIVRAVWSAGGR